MKNSRLIYVGDYGQDPVSDRTLEAYGVEFLKNGDRKWRRSSINRSKNIIFEQDMAAVQRYFWKRSQDVEDL